MDRCSYFIKNKALFGSYPTQKSVEELENNGVRYFINLTCDGEKRITPYNTYYEYLRYPIRDHNIPTNWQSFARFILRICNIIKKLKTGQLIYIHCKGGHGRSGLVVACVLCYLYKMIPIEALRLTGEYHSKRKEMREKRRRLGSPPGEFQKDFVKRFFHPLYFNKACNHGITAGMSNCSIHSVQVPNLGIFPTAKAAFQAHKNPENKEYVRKQELSSTHYISKKLGQTCKIPEDWDDKKCNIMFEILKLKFQQHDNIRENLLNTGLRPIIKHDSNKYWGDGKDGSGKNILGRMLTKIRNKLYTF